MYLCGCVVLLCFDAYYILWGSVLVTQQTGHIVENGGAGGGERRGGRRGGGPTNCSRSTVDQLGQDIVI